MSQNTRLTKESKLLTLNCTHCAGEFEAKTRNAKYCSEYCITWRKYLGPGESKHCSDCGTPMLMSGSSKAGPGRCVSCSKHGFGGYKRGCRCDVCRETANSWQRTRSREHFETTGEWLNGAWIKREARLKLYERDGWVCQICFESVNKGEWSADPLDPTLDHIMPRSKGGGHEPENLRTAHWVCNGRRGDRTE